MRLKRTPSWLNTSIFVELELLLRQIIYSQVVAVILGIEEMVILIGNYAFRNVSDLLISVQQLQEVHTRERMRHPQAHNRVSKFLITGQSPPPSTYRLERAPRHTQCWIYLWVSNDIFLSAYSSFHPTYVNNPNSQFKSFERIKAFQWSPSILKCRCPTLFFCFVGTVNPR